MVAGCWSEEPRIDDTFTADEWSFIQQFKAPAPDLCPSAFDDDLEACTLAADFGKRLFSERALSGVVTVSDPLAPGPKGATGTIACVDCHDAKKFFIDTRSQPSNLSFGAKGRTKHNAMSVVNASLKSTVMPLNCEEDDADPFECRLVFSWTGKYPSAGEVLKIAGPKAMNASGITISRALRANQSYLESYITLFGGFPPICEADDTCHCDPGLPCHLPEQDKDNPGENVFDNISLVFDTYVRQLNSVSSPLDCYLESDVKDNRTTPPTRAECQKEDMRGIPVPKTLGEVERRGLSIFIGKAMCVECHHGPLLSDLKFHNTGVAQVGPNVATVAPTDGGYGEEVFGTGPDAFLVPDERLGEFMTPPLRHVEKTAPYMHAGQLGTLSEVIDFYRRGGDREGFSGRKDLRIQPLEITDDEARDLEAFLRSLTGDETSLKTWAPPEPMPMPMMVSP